MNLNILRHGTHGRKVGEVGMKEIVFNVDEQNFFAMDGLQWELVRCKDCKHIKDCAINAPYCDKGHFFNGNPDWFCADGERKGSI